MASDEALDRDLLFRKLKTKADNKVITVIAPFCEGSVCFSPGLLCVWLE